MPSHSLEMCHLDLSQLVRDTALLENFLNRLLKRVLGT